MRFVHVAALMGRSQREYELKRDLCIDTLPQDNAETRDNGAASSRMHRGKVNLTEERRLRLTVA